jgi:nucleoside-diphosphate-sugar epimerase
MNNIVLMTGSLGFIGNQVLNNLICSGIKIRIVLRTNTNFYFKDHSFIDSIVYTDDLFKEDIEWWINCLKGVATIFHSAWYTNTEDYLYSKKNFNCYRGSLILAKAACFVGIKRFICIGSAWILWLYRS